MNTLIQSKENLESSICFSHHRWRSGLLVRVWMGQAFEEVFEEGRWGAISGWTGQPYSLLKPHWQKGFSSGKATMQWGMSGSHISLHPAKQEPQLCLCKLTSNGMGAAQPSPAQSPTRRESSLQYTSNSPHHLLVLSLVSISISLKEGY